MDMQSKLILLTVAFVLVGLVRGYCAMKEMEKLSQINGTENRHACPVLLDYFQRRIDPYL